MPFLLESVLQTFCTRNCKPAVSCKQHSEYVYALTTPFLSPPPLLPFLCLISAVNQSVFFSVCLPAYLSVCLSPPPILLKSINEPCSLYLLPLSDCLSISVFLSQSVCLLSPSLSDQPINHAVCTLSLCLSVCLSISVFFCLSLSVSFPLPSQINQ